MTSRIHGYFLRAIACLFAGAVSVIAQTSVTPPVGFNTITIEPGLKTLGLPLVRTATATSTVASSSAAVITADSASLNFGPLLAPSIPYYLEITGGSSPQAVGDRYDIDVAATIASANNTVTVTTLSPNNTTVGNLPDLAGARFVIRPHLTLGSIFGIKGATPMHGALLAADADQVIFWNPVLNSGAGAYETYFLYRTPDGATEEWRKADGSLASFDNLIIAPGVGMLVRHRSTNPASIIVTGAVRTTAVFTQNLREGLNLVSAAYPADASPSERQYTTAHGWTGSTVATHADRVEAWNPSLNGGAGGFEPYFLLKASSVEQWRRAGGGTTDFAATRIFSSDEAIFIRKVTAQPDSITPSSVPAEAAVRYDFSSPFFETARTSNGSLLDGTFSFSLGVFGSGFVPTAINQAQWLQNFTALGVTSWTQESGGSGEFYGSAFLNGNASPLLADAQLYIWGFNSTSVSPASEWVLLTNPTSTDWKVITDPGLPVSRTLDISTPGTVAIAGSLGATGADPYLRTAVPISATVPATPPWALLTLLSLFFASVAFGPSRQLL